MSEVPIFDRYSHVPRRISSEWAQAALDASTLPPFIALTSLHLTLQNDHYLDEFLEHHTAFPNLKELVALFTWEVSAAPKSTERSFYAPKHLVPSWPNLTRLEFGRSADYDRDRADERAVNLKRLCKTFEFAASTLVEWTIGMDDGLPVLDNPPRFFFQLFPAFEYPQLQHLAVPALYTTIVEYDLDEHFPSLRRLRFFADAPHTDRYSVIPPLPASLEYLDLVYPCDGLRQLLRLPSCVPSLKTLRLSWREDPEDLDPDFIDNNRHTLLEVRRALEKAGIACRGVFEVLDSDSDTDDATFEEDTEDTDSSDDELSDEVIDSDEEEKRRAELERREKEKWKRQRERRKRAQAQTGTQ
ncbi:putative Lactoylglutathione lyase Glo1 [Rhodotorula toruloides ATCC 204091]|uniref:Putative Lactoylglutathione lyase Glo1 n=2 Tax=Rhodotorula toruloides TaxID=5286 RepID=A0A2T0AGS7_RHOTO|nr:putative Lactoylglutathione lyase Glo1 [Rhodotorula toruloides ATCC 204091]KAK4331944.1 putative Lactoylglutathione lyase Glo1 [Rhodotorula toruloides]PRQ77195.1 putative Lactoylglutathione lyase Glo1 [Rhodotorula toruloides]